MADSNITPNPKSAVAGMNTDSSVDQLREGQVSYALNANVQNFDGESINYQNDSGNSECFTFPEGYSVIGKYTIIEESKHIFFLVNTSEEKSEIGYSIGDTCIYNTLINADCLNFNINNPILKVAHRKTNCGTEIYWPDHNGRRYLNLDELPYKRQEGTDICDNKFTTEIDCNKLSIQPKFDIPSLFVKDKLTGGDQKAGTVQFAIQYSDADGFGYTSYYSVTNPTPLFTPNIVTPDFNYPVGKSIVIGIDNIDISGVFEYFNLAVIKTINNISSVELVGTYSIDSSNTEIIYSGQNKTQIRLTIDDIFEKFPSYELADDVTAVSDVLVWKGLSSVDRINLQKIANQIKLQWQTWRLPVGETYADEINATNLRGYIRDEVYAFEFVPLLNNGKQLDGFHIPGRAISILDYGEVSPSDPDYIGIDGDPNPYWRNNNTAIVIATESTSESDYKGPHQYGDFGFWQSSDIYPCEEEVWGDLAGQPIRHHKFPDVNICPLFESPTPDLDADGQYTDLSTDDRAIYPLGVRININEIQNLINQSDLTSDQKNSIVGFKIVRGDRANNKSIVAKGILRNVGKYTRENTEYYFPNYPYNDLKEDPFLLKENNAYADQCITYTITATADTIYTYRNCFTNTDETENILTGETAQVCSILLPTLSDIADGTVTSLNFETYYAKVSRPLFGIRTLNFKYQDPTNTTKYVHLEAGTFTRLKNRSITVNVLPGSEPIVTYASSSQYQIKKVSENIEVSCYPERLKAFESEDSKLRHVFNSPETSYGQPFLGDVLKLENILYGKGTAHFVPVKNNALYRLLSKEAQEDALDSSAKLANITATFNSVAFFTAYQTYLQIYLNSAVRKNYGYSYNSILNYNYSAPIDYSLGIKQRKIDKTQYLYPGVQSINDDLNLNNFQRESSVYIKTDSSLPYPSESNSLISGVTTLIEDDSRAIASEVNCTEPEQQFDITSVVYYASMKNSFLNQWGQIYSYNTIDTGSQIIFDNSSSSIAYIFGGDTFIGKHTFKTKLPFFIDNRVDAPNDSDIYYDEIGNVAYPEYWHSARNILFDYEHDDIGSEVLKNIISIKAHHLDCPNNQLPAPDPSPASGPAVINPDRTFYDGKMYMFAYGIPSFYCESSINLDLRQAVNYKEGDFYPRVSSGIPDEWLQETNVPIAQDNTYFYNVTYSKQNKENLFTHLPPNWEDSLCFTKFPKRVIYSDPSQGPQINNWLIYRPISYFDFPQNYGNLTAIDGIDNQQLLARFENKSLLYNALYTNQVNTGGQVYLGQTLFNKQTPPLDLASDTDIGFVGSQHKFLLKIPQGYLTIDSKRGQVFLVSGNSVTDLSSVEYGNHQFFVDHLPFEIKKYFPEINIDNHFKGIGLHGVYDSKYSRVFITKLDYIPLVPNIEYDGDFYIEQSNGLKEIIQLGDPLYFCNKSWTISFNFNIKAWVGFHTFLPNFYISENNFFYTGLNVGCDVDIFAAEIVETTTTTTSIIPSPFDCELEGEVEILDCLIEATAELILGCEIEATAVDYTPATTTTSTTIEPTTTTTSTTEEEITTTTTTTLE